MENNWRSTIFTLWVTARNSFEFFSFLCFSLP